MDYRIFPPDGLVEARVDLPRSKSILNRALLINSLTPGAALPADAVGVCDDIDIMARALASDAAVVDVGRSGTAMRFLTARFAVDEGRERVVDGDARMRRRPIGPLVDALRACGADISYEGEEGFPPLRVRGRRLRGGDVAIDAAVSSQYVSALLLVAPLMDEGLRLRLEGERIASEPYIALTTGMMTRAGIDVSREGDTLTVAPGAYRPAVFEAEADWSAAAFWYEVEALTSGFLSLTPLDPASLQPDREAAALFYELGVETVYDGEDALTELCGMPDVSPRLRRDMSATPDLVPAVVVTACLLRVPFHLTGVASLRLKESDRIAALQEELGRLGIVLDTPDDDTLEWEGRIVPVGELPVFDSHADHRMAMALAPVAVYVPGIVVRDAGVVDKSYPGYWDSLRAAGFTLEEVTEA